MKFYSNEMKKDSFCIHVHRIVDEHWIENSATVTMLNRERIDFFSSTSTHTHFQRNMFNALHWQLIIIYFEPIN